MSLRRFRLLHPCLFALACGGTSPPPALEPAPAVAAPAPAPDAPEPAAAPPPPPLAIPGDCAPGQGDPCMPGAAFADRICAAPVADVGLALFAKGSPWTRFYLRGDVDGWNAEGASTRARLAFDEEVIVLKRRAPAGGAVGMIVVGAGGGYQVMRWDGNCFSLEDGELTRRRPPRAKHSGIPFRHLGEKTKSALLADAGVKAAFERVGKECKGVSMGAVSPACERADAAFSDGIVAAVKSGIALPTPEL